MIAFVGFSKYSTVYDEIVQTQLLQTSVEVNSAIEAKYEQISTIAAQVSTDADIQQLMFNMMEQERLTSGQAQQFRRTLNRYYPYVNSVYDYRFYQLDGNAIYPNVGDLQFIIDEIWIKKAIDANGRLVWGGQDKANNGYSYAIKTIRLINHSYINSGFLVLKIENKYFDTDFEKDRNFIQVYDSSKQLIGGRNSPNLLSVENGRLLIENEHYYIAKNVSKRTNWTVYVAQSLNASLLEIQNIRYFIIILSLVAIIICFSLSWIFASYITLPLKRLITAMQQEPERKLQHVKETYSSIEMHTLHRTYNEFITQIETLIEEVYEKQLHQQHAELRALQAQINPHFLYNTLNAFYWKLIDEEKDELADYVLSMSALFKYSVGSSIETASIATIQQELEHTEHYLKLMQMRLGTRLSWTLQCDDSLKMIKIPKLLLQPIIENAILHGIEQQQTNGIINLQIYENNDASFTILISDNGKGMSPEILESLNRSTYDSNSEHIGVQNIRKRLEMFYSTSMVDAFIYTSNRTIGTTVTITLPKG